MLLDWDAEDLAEKAGVTRETVFNIERGTFRPRPATLEKILKAFDEGGVEFIGERGTALRHDVITTYEGPDYYVRFLEDVRQAALREKTEVLFFNVDDSISSPEVVKINRRMLEDGIPCRYLCSEKPKKIALPKKFYRGIPQSHFRNGLQVVYGHFLATSVRGKMILAIRNEDVAASARNLFDLVWQKSRPPEVQDA